MSRQAIPSAQKTPPKTSTIREANICPRNPCGSSTKLKRSSQSLRRTAIPFSSVPLATLTSILNDWKNFTTVCSFMSAISKVALLQMRISNSSARRNPPLLSIVLVGVCIVRCVPSLNGWESPTLFAGSTLRRTRSITTSENSIRIRKRVKLNFTISVATLVSSMSSHPQITQRNSNRSLSEPLSKRPIQMATDSSSVK